MGNLLCWRTDIDEVDANNSGNNQPAESTKKTYSWDNKKRENAQNFIIKNVDNEIRAKFPSEINGEQFIIQNCSKSRIYLLDIVGTLTIDDCINCQFIVGPVKSSVFIRDCKQCEILVACQQFRTRDCDRLTAFLACATVPVIENTTKFKTGPYQLSYNKLEEQFVTSGLSIFNCNWTEIHDFTPIEEGILNYHYLDANVAPSSLITDLNNPVDSTDGSQPAGDGGSSDLLTRINDLNIMDTPDSSIVPYTYSSRRRSFMASKDAVFSLVVLFQSQPNSAKLGRDLISFVTKEVPETYLTKSNQLKLSLQTIEKLFENEASYMEKAKQDSIVYLEFSSVQSLNEIIYRFCSENNLSSSDIYVSSDSNKSKHDINLISQEFKVHMAM